MRNTTQEAAPLPKQGFSIIKPSNIDTEFDEQPYYEQEFDFWAPFWRALAFIGIKTDSLSREEAAHAILERPIRIIYRPTIVEINHPSRNYE